MSTDEPTIMKNFALIPALVAMGLTDHEARVYYACLSIGPSAIQAVSRASGVKRTTVYGLIESLKAKGLISIQIRGFKKLFVAENPERLETILEERKRKLAEVLPEFSALYALGGEESTIKYYEGLEAVKTAYEGLLEVVMPGDDYRVISDQRRWHALDPRYFQRFIERRAKLDLRIRMILEDSDIAREHKKFQRNYNEKVKIMPRRESFPTNLVITPRRVVIHQLVPPISAIVLENQSAITMHKELFEMLWDSLL